MTTKTCITYKGKIHTFSLTYTHTLALVVTFLLCLCKKLLLLNKMVHSPRTEQWLWISRGLHRSCLFF